MVEEISVTLTYNGQERKVFIYLPDDYKTSDKTYPVMYMYDGHNLFFDEYATFGKSWGLKDYMDIKNDKCIIVGIDANHNGDDRLNEYCPYSCYGFGRRIKGEGKLFMDWLVNELKPFIDKNYPTKTDRDNTFIGGSSMGGLMAYYSVLTYNDVFSKAAVLSPSFMICTSQIIKLTSDTNINPNTRIFISFGSLEFGPFATRELNAIQELNNGLVKLIQTKGGKAKYLFLEGAKHNEASWGRIVPLFMNYLWHHDD